MNGFKYSAGVLKKNIQGSEQYFKIHVRPYVYNHTEKKRIRCLNKRMRRYASRKYFLYNKYVFLNKILEKSLWKFRIENYH